MEPKLGSHRATQDATPPTRKTGFTQGAAMTRENWQTALDEVERGVRDCLSALDRYEASFDGVLTSSRTEATPEATTDRWDQSLASAGERVSRVEHLLEEQEEVWQRWHAALNRWEQSLQQPG